MTTTTSTTTSHFQKLPDYYTNIEECTNASKNFNKQQSNPRYKNFNQTEFTAGDEQQFNLYRDTTNSQSLPIDLSSNIFQDLLTTDYWKDYSNLDGTCVINTFRYIFNKFKKGIFVKILNNSLKVFLPFSKNNFTNEWSSQIYIDPQFKNLEDFMQYIFTLENRNFNPKRVNNDITTWYANNCLVRLEYPINEGDTNVSNVKNMLEELCNSRTIPDIEFFINRRDFPILTKHHTEPYYHIWNTTDKPLLSHNYEKYSPILSMCVTDNYADVLIPIHEDWGRVKSQENIWFPKGCKVYNTFTTSWINKIPTAVFRGSSTGCGTTIESNNRLKLSKLSSTFGNDQEDNIPFLDAGITSWNLRPRKLKNEKYLKTININSLPISLVDKLTPEQQSHYKYIVNVDGHVTAFRLSYELNMGSVILLVKSKWKIWYSDMLIPYKHYVPIKEDLSDLLDRIKWCKKNDDKCEEIAKNARQFYETYLNKKGILDYLQKTFTDLKKVIGNYQYNVKTPLEIQTIIEKENIYTHSLFHPAIPNISSFSTSSTILENVTPLPSYARSYGLLQAIQWIISIADGDLLKVSKFTKNIVDTKLISITERSFYNFPIILKSSLEAEEKKIENIHEIFVGMNCINNLIKYIPNFVYTLGMYKTKITNNEIVLNSLWPSRIDGIFEKLNGQTLSEYIKGSTFNMKNFLFMVIQICLSLEIAQNNCCFVHNDLTPWNIIIQSTGTKLVEFDYIVNYDNIIRIKTNLIPVIIDYGRSHVIYEGIHYGIVNPYKTSKIQDIISLILTTVSEIITFQTLNFEDMKDIFYFYNFITNTTYCKGKANTVRDIRNFIQHAKKYPELISSNKYELENRTPMDLVKYLLDYKKYSFEYEKTNVYVPKMNNHSAKKIYDKLLNLNIENDGICTSYPNPKNIFFLYYAAQSIYDVTKNESVKKFYKEQINLLKKQKDVEQKIAYEIKGNFSKLDQEDFTDTIFLSLEKLNILKEKYNKIKENTNDYSVYREIIIDVLLNNGEFKLSEEERDTYTNNFKNLLNTNPVNIKNNIANIKTLNFIDAEINNYNKVEHNKVGHNKKSNTIPLLESKINEVETNEVENNFIIDIVNEETKIAEEVLNLPSELYKEITKDLNNLDNLIEGPNQDQQSREAGKSVCDLIALCNKLFGFMRYEFEEDDNNLPIIYTKLTAKNLNKLGIMNYKDANDYGYINATFFIKNDKLIVEYTNTDENQETKVVENKYKKLRKCLLKTKYDASLHSLNALGYNTSVKHLYNDASILKNPLVTYFIKKTDQIFNKLIMNNESSEASNISDNGEIEAIVADLEYKKLLTLEMFKTDTEKLEELLIKEIGINYPKKNISEKDKIKVKFLIQSVKESVLLLSLKEDVNEYIAEYKTNSSEMKIPDNSNWLIKDKVLVG